MDRLIEVINNFPLQIPQENQEPAVRLVDLLPPVAPPRMTQEEMDELRRNLDEQFQRDDIRIVEHEGGTFMMRTIVLGEEDEWQDNEMDEENRVIFIEDEDERVESQELVPEEPEMDMDMN